MVATASPKCRLISICLTVAVACLFLVRNARDAAHWIVVGRVDLDATTKRTTTKHGANRGGGGANATASPLVSADPWHANNSLVDDALQFVLNRRVKYELAGMGVNWNLRGIGFLYSHLHVVLAGYVVRPDSQAHSRSRHSIRIVNVLSPEARARDANRSDFHVAQPLGRNGCDRLTIWVRAAGPEVFAGSAEAVHPDGPNQACHWAFDFQPTMPGEYTIDAKVLVWNGKNRDYKTEQKCQTWRRGSVPAHWLHPDNDTLPSAGFKGFKFYFAEHACCEICSRLRPHCRFWSNPPRQLAGHATLLSNGCQLYFDPATTPTTAIPKSWMFHDLNVTFPSGDATHRSRRMRAASRDRPPQESFGEPHGGEPQWFVGCGWSNWFTLDFPCLSGDLDDRVHFAHATIVVSPQDTGGQPIERSDLVNTDASASEARGSDVNRPLCHSQYELMGRSEGRWVVLEGDGTEIASCSPLVVDKNASQQFDLYNYDGTKPHCWHLDNINAIGNRCLEANCKSIWQGSVWNSKFRRRQNATGKKSDLVWGVWRERWCDYVEFTDAQLQQCIDAKKIASIRIEGRSVASFLRSYVDQRIRKLRLYSNATTDADAIDVVVTTLHMLHRVRESNDEIRQQLGKLKDATPTRHVYYVNGFYTSSEREMYTHVERMADLNRLMDDVLPQKGYKPLNAYDMSAAWTYDTATQRDGMHVIGPPMRMIVTKLFHYICSSEILGAVRV